MLRPQISGLFAGAPYSVPCEEQPARVVERVRRVVHVKRALGELSKKEPMAEVRVAELLHKLDKSLVANFETSGRDALADCITLTMLYRCADEAAVLGWMEKNEDYAARVCAEHVGNFRLVDSAIFSELTCAGDFDRPPATKFLIAMVDYLKVIKVGKGGSWKDIANEMR